VFRGFRSEFRDLVTSLLTKAEPLPYSELHSHLFTHEVLHMNSLQSIPTAILLLPTPMQPLSAFAAQSGFSIFNGSGSSHNRGRGSYGS
jgi:hypothetical protein